MPLRSPEPGEGKRVVDPTAVFGHIHSVDMLIDSAQRSQEFLDPDLAIIRVRPHGHNRIGADQAEQIR